MKILGIDPGLAGTGFAVLSTRTQSPKAIRYGTIRSRKDKPLGERIKMIVSELKKIIRKEKVNSCACESLFFKKAAAKSVILSSHLRGAILYLLAQENIPIWEVHPQRLKLAITGQGRASKRQMNYMIKNLLNITDRVSEDEADALACAYYLKEKINQRKR
jgi:crossover junction endodeoxyribonuclease RuvC